MNILFLSAHYPPKTRGGGEISAHLIAQGLTSRGHSVHVVTAGDTAQELEVDGVTVEHGPLPLTAKPLFERAHARKMASGLTRHVRDLEQYDAVHAHDFRSAQFLAELVEQGTIPASKCIATVRDYAQICGSPTGLLADGTMCAPCNSLATVQQLRPVIEGPAWRRPFRIWQYWYNTPYRLKAFRRIPQHIYISQAQQGHVARVQDLSGIQTYVIYNPVSPSFLVDQSKEAAPKNLLFVGTMASYKGVAVLLEAFAELAREDSEAQLTLVGDGEQQSVFEHFVDQHGLQYRVTFKSAVEYSKVRSLYDEAAIVVAPHIWIEPFGRTVVEAMAREKIVVASDIGGPSEVIEDGATGFLVKPNSVVALKEKLHEVLSLSTYDRRDIQRAARRWVTENLSQGSIAQEYESVYEGINTVA